MTVQLGQVKFVPCVCSVEKNHDVGNGVPGWNASVLELDEGLELFRSQSNKFRAGEVTDRT